MTDLEMTKLCAEAMGIKLRERTGARNTTCGNRDLLETEQYLAYDPLNNKAQAMELVMRFGMAVDLADNYWYASLGERHQACACGDLSRAIVECVAEMQRATSEKGSALPPDKAEAK